MPYKTCRESKWSGANGTHKRHDLITTNSYRITSDHLTLDVSLGHFHSSSSFFDEFQPLHIPQLVHKVELLD
jgi:hypothetical protein